MFVFQEMDSIVDQMMTVAEYIGWETKELRPVRNSYFLRRCASYWHIIYIYIYTYIYSHDMNLCFYLDTSRNDARDRLWFWRHGFFRRMETWRNDHNSTTCTSWLRYGMIHSISKTSYTYDIQIILESLSHVFQKK